MLNLLRISITLIILWLISNQLEWSGITEKFLSAKWWWIIIAITIQIIILVIGSIRWYTFLHHERTSHKIHQLIKPYFIGAFFNNILPTTTGGDALRVYHIYKQGYGISLSASPIIMEQIIGLCVMLGTALSVIFFIGFESEWIQPLQSLILTILSLFILLLSIIGHPKTYIIF
jgi:uncharacterized protein (TIRG00374 family)